MRNRSGYAVTIFAILASLNQVKAQENLSEVVFTPHFIRINEKGGFFEKTWPQLNTPEFKTAVDVACAALGCAPLVSTILQNAGKIPIAQGENYATSGHIDKQAGEEWWISFPPPLGYVTCSAAYDSKTISANKGDATSGTVFRGPQGDWVGSYNEVPKHRPQGHWVSVDFVTKYVKSGTEGNHQCVPDGTPVWRVKL
ncbi:MAG: hypothetical protein ACLP4V_17030 [Methylocella sp.]